MTEIIIFDGNVYQHLSDMPSDARERYDRITQIFQDDNLDGIPDLIQSNGLKGIREVFNFVKEVSQSGKQNGNFDPDRIAVIQITDSDITINGRKFKNIDDMPPEIRKVFERLVREIDPSELDILNDQKLGTNKTPRFSLPNNEVGSSNINNTEDSTSVIQEVNSPRLLILVIVSAAIALCGLGIWLVTNAILPMG